jgi:hypothetical protein
MSVDPQHKAFLDDYVGRLHRVITVDDDICAQISATRAIWLETRERGGRVIFIGNGVSAGRIWRSIPRRTLASRNLLQRRKRHHLPRQRLWFRAMAGPCGAADSATVRLPGCHQRVGRSKNILNAVAKAREMKLEVVTMSGMSLVNPLRSLGDINYWVDSRSYNIVETAHQFCMMAVVDLIIGRAEYPAS